MASTVKIDLQPILKDLAKIHDKLKTIIQEEIPRTSDPDLLTKPQPELLSTEELKHRNGSAWTLYAFFGIEQLIEYLVIELGTLRQLTDPVLSKNYFNPAISESDKTILIQHYVVSVKRSFILNLSMILESNIRRIVDDYSLSKPKSRKEHFIKVCGTLQIPDSSIKKLLKECFGSEFIEFHYYLKVMPYLAPYRPMIDYIQIVRNSGHNGGFHKGKNREIVYPGNTIKFSHGVPSELNFSNMVPLIEDTYQLFLTIKEELDKQTKSRP